MEMSGRIQNKVAVILMAAIVCVAVASCAHSRSGSGGDWSAPESRREGTGRYHGAIKAATKLYYPSDRDEVLRDIASKTDLEECDQLYLVGVIPGAVYYPSNRTLVVKALVANPAATPRTREEIARRLDDLIYYPSDRTEIAKLMVEASGARQK